MQKRKMTKEQEKQLEKKCHAICDSGYSCRRKAVKGEAFCDVHLRYGYALFTLAVLEQIKTVKFTQLTA